MNTTKEQNKILKKHFGLIIKSPVSSGGNIAIIPKWQKIGQNYNAALQKVLDSIASTRPFYNWRKGEIGPDRLRPLQRDVPEILSVQLGTKWKGVSVQNVRKEKAQDEILLGAYEVGMMILLNPDILKSPDDLWLDCPGDEYDDPDSDVRFDSAPCFRFRDGRVEFGTVCVGDASGDCGSASGFASQPLEARPLDSFAPLTLDSAIERVKKEGYVIFKPI